MGSEAAQCERHRRPTHVRCAGCDKPICPRCYVRTPVSVKCAPCAGVRPSTARDRARRYAFPLVLGALVVGGLTVFLSSEAVQGRRDAGQARPNPVTEVAVGQEARERGLAFLVTKLDCQGKEVPSSPVGRSALGRFCLLHVRVRNAGIRPEMFSSSLQVLLDAKGNRYGVDSALTQMPQQGIRVPPAMQMNPGTQVDRVLAYDVPEDVTPRAAEFHSRPRSLGVRVLLSPT